MTCSVKVVTASAASPDSPRFYLFEGLLGRAGPGLWRSRQFWEDTFLDSVAAEREATGLDAGPGEMLERYRGLGEAERRRLEQAEDRLLATMLYNITAFMVMMQLDQADLKRIARRLLGRSHIGLVYSQEINLLLDRVS